MLRTSAKKARRGAEEGCQGGVPRRGAEEGCRGCQGGVHLADEVVRGEGVSVPDLEAQRRPRRVRVVVLALGLG